MTRLTLRERIFGVAEDRAFPAPENELPLFAAYTATPVNTRTALAIGDVWAAVRVLSDAASSLPLHVYRKQGDGRERVTSGFLVDLLDRPAPGTSQADWISTMVSHLAIHGNAYVAKFREAGAITRIDLLDPERVRPEIVGGQLRFRYSPRAGGQQLLSERDLIHVKGLSTDGLIGLSAVTQAAKVLGLSDELVKHAISYFEQDKVRPAGVLKMPPGASAEARQRMIESLRGEAARSSPGMHTLVVEGEGEYEPVQGRLDDQQFTEQRRLAAQEVARCFRIPPRMIGAPTSDSMTYANVEQASLEFVRYSLTPWLRRIELAISGDRDLTSERQFVRFEVDGLLRADARTRSEVYARALDPVVGWMSRDEVRRLEDLPPEGDRAPSVEAMLPRPPAPAVAETNGGTDE